MSGFARASLVEKGSPVCWPHRRRALMRNSFRSSSRCSPSPVVRCQAGLVAPAEPMGICYASYGGTLRMQNIPLNRKDLFLRACRGEALPRVPVWMMRQAGRYLPEDREIRAKHAFLEVCKTPELATEVSLQPFRRLDVDAVIVFSDILIPAEAMGLKLELGDAGPNLPEPVRSQTGVAKLREFDPEGEPGFLMETIRRIVREVGPSVPVLGFAAGPWTLACYMVEGRTKEGFSTVKSFLYHDPG